MQAARNHLATTASPNRRASLRALAYPCGFLITAAPSEGVREPREIGGVQKGVSRLAALHPRHPGELVAPAPDSHSCLVLVISGAAARSGRLASLAMYSNGAGPRAVLVLQ